MLFAVIALMSAGCTKSELVQEVTECTFQVGLDADIRMKSDPAAPQTLLADRCVMELFYNGESAESTKSRFRPERRSSLLQ